jgi:hydroxyacylglutathione hydrolase
MDWSQPVSSRFSVIAIEIAELGNRSYIVHDGHSAIVIDPSRRIRQVIEVAQANKLAIEAVFETHVHNDYVTGGYALAQKLGIPYYISKHEHTHFTHEGIVPEQTIKFGAFSVTALAAPGHTPHHLGYLVEAPDQPAALFSGGSLLYGAVGRTDLVSPEMTAKLAGNQYQTAQFFAARLDPSTLLYPTHGFGSFCAATETQDVQTSTIGRQLATNSAYTSKDESSFVEELLDGLESYPSYYAYMAPANLRGPLEPDLIAPALLTKETLMSALHSGAGIVDMRSRKAYAARHMSGTYNIELNDDLATYVGWLIKWDEPLILVAETADEVGRAQEKLSLIGREVSGGQMRPDDLLKAASKTSSYPVHDFADLAKVIDQPNISVIDVRRNSEWKKGHIESALHIPLHELISRADEIPKEAEVWVHCAAGFRASIAASILAGIRSNVVLINDNFANAQKAELEIVGDNMNIVSDVKSGNVQLLDVRDDSEWKERHAKDAIHIQLNDLMEGKTEPLDKQKPIYAYCLSGNRSAMAEMYLNDHGFDALNIGGLEDWLEAGGRLVLDI